MAEDLLHDLWMRLPREGSEIEHPQRYLYRMANHLVIDIRRRAMQAMTREAKWHDVRGTGASGQSEEPAADRTVIARQLARRVAAVVDGEGERAARVFRRHRIDGLTQRAVAAEMGLSVGTIEGDLRRVYRALAMFRQENDEE